MQDDVLINQEEANNEDITSSNNMQVTDEPSARSMVTKEEALKDEFYVRYYIGHRGDFGHEYLQFELLPNGLLRYTNNSMYKKDGEIHKEAYISASIMDEFRKMIVDSDIMNADDEVWPRPDELGKQELEIVMNNEHISLATRKIGTSNEVSRTKDPEGLMNFYFLTQDLKAFVLSLIRLHFKIKPL